MRKTDVEKILQQNFEEAQKLVWKHGKPCDYPCEDMREIELPNGGVKVIIGIDEGKVTKVRTWEDSGMEYYYEAEEKDYVESICDNFHDNDGWTLDCDFAHGTENRIYLAIGKMFGK